MKSRLYCLLTCLTVALAACYSRPVERQPVEAARSEPARAPLSGSVAAVYFGDEYAQEQRALAARPHEPVAPTF